MPPNASHVKLVGGLLKGAIIQGQAPGHAWANVHADEFVPSFSGRLRYRARE